MNPSACGLSVLLGIAVLFLAIAIPLPTWINFDQKHYGGGRNTGECTVQDNEYTSEFSFGLLEYCAKEAVCKRNALFARTDTEVFTYKQCTRVSNQGWACGKRNDEAIYENGDSEFAAADKAYKANYGEKFPYDRQAVDVCKTDKSRFDSVNAVFSLAIIGGVIVLLAFVVALLIALEVDGSSGMATVLFVLVVLGAILLNIGWIVFVAKASPSSLTKSRVRDDFPMVEDPQKAAELRNCGAGGCDDLDKIVSAMEEQYNYAYGAGFALYLVAALLVLIGTCVAGLVMAGGAAGSGGGGGGGGKGGGSSDEEDSM